jgi:hypothetical protein
MLTNTHELEKRIVNKELLVFHKYQMDAIIMSTYQMPFGMVEET